jgi:uncharacterized protein (DUF58 family)
VTLPTPRALVVLAVLAPVALLGYVGPAALDVLLALDLAVLALVLVDAALAADPRRLRVERDSPAAFSLGEEGRVGYAWSNPTALAARLLVKESRPPILGGGGTPRRVRVPARGTAREALTVRPARRGRATAGWLAVRSFGPLGLGLRQAGIELPWSATVFPPLPRRRCSASVAQAVRRRELGVHRLRRLGEGRVFESLREWVPGDDVATIDWKATARRRKLIVRQYEEERRQHVLLVLDAGRLLTAEVAGVARMEYVVGAAVRLAMAATRRDDDVGIMVFADEVQQYVAPQRGRRGLKQVLDVLAVVQPALVEPDYPAAFRHLAIRNRKRALTVLFTDVIDRLASEALVAGFGSLAPRHLPLAVTLRNPELDAIAAGRPEHIHDAYRKAAAEDLLRARDDALAVMRRAGVLVLDVAPAQAGPAVVEKYVELKRRGRI